MLASMGLTVVRLQAQVRPERVRIGENIAAGMVAKKVQPVYPSEARSKQISGAVRMQINISKKGASKT